MKILVVRSGPEGPQFIRSVGTLPFYYIKKKQIAQKIRENVVADQISAYVIYEWSPSQAMESRWKMERC